MLLKLTMLCHLLTAHQLAYFSKNDFAKQNVFHENTLAISTFNYSTLLLIECQ